MRELLDSPWQTLSIPFALTPIGQLHQSPPSPVPGCSCSGLLVGYKDCLLYKRRTEDFHRAHLVKFVSFTGAFTGKHVVKSVKEACETVHSTPKETCQHATQFDRPCRTVCFWWVKKTPKDAQECEPGLCKFVGFFHIFPSSYLRRCKGLTVPKRDHQKMHRKSLYTFQTHEDARGPHVINFPHLLQKTISHPREHSG